MGDTFDAKKFGPTLAIPFVVTNATTQLTNSDAVRAGGSGTGWVAPYAGSVVAIGARASGALTAGTITVKGHSASTEFTQSGAPAPAINSGAQQSYGTVAPGLIRFAAGDVLGISVSTTTTLDPTNTLEVEAELYVQLDPK